MNELAKTDELFNKDDMRAIDALHRAHFIAFAPYVWEASKLLREKGILRIVFNHKDGISFDDIFKEINISHYGLRILLEAGLGIGLLYAQDNLYFLTKTGYFFINNESVHVNYKFMKDVCFDGVPSLEESIKKSRPEGLKNFGPWSTVYEGLSKLPGEVKDSWFGFDHFYSDNTFDVILPMIFKDKPKNILDIGGNTGKWALKCLEYDKDVRIGVVDLEGQINVAKKTIADAGFSDRVDFYTIDMLSDAELPQGYDVIWMSQFLDCFSDDQIVSILQKCHESSDEHTRVYINETFWDLQRFETSAFILQMTSLYFTTIANGTSQMYDSKVFLRFTEEAGFKLVDKSELIGHGHTLLMLNKK
ncbi:MAG: class I SAM-dependent methyltransferase [Brumimicrobium sp.]